MLPRSKESALRIETQAGAARTQVKPRVACNNAVALLLVAVSSSALAADPPKPIEPGPWKFGTTATLNFTQSTYSSNWSGGDRGSMQWVLGADSEAGRQLSGTFNLANHLVLAYGQRSNQVTGAGGGLRWDAPEKSTDKIEFESIGRWTFQSFVDPYASLRLDSQFSDEAADVFGLGRTINFNPVQLKESAGIARILRKTDDAQTLMRLGFGFRQALGRGFKSAAANDKERFTSNDGGIEWQTDIKEPVLEKKVLYKGQLLVFLPLFYSKSEDLRTIDGLAASPGRESVADFWKAPDVNFQNTFSAAITKHVGVDLFVQLVYDKFNTAANIDKTKDLALEVTEIDRNVRKAGQFKQTLSVALSYRLF
jgi:hypothetical protein